MTVTPALRTAKWTRSHKFKLDLKMFSHGEIFSLWQNIFSKLCWNQCRIEACKTSYDMSCDKNDKIFAHFFFKKCRFVWYNTALSEEETKLYSQNYSVKKQVPNCGESHTNHATAWLSVSPRPNCERQDRPYFKRQPQTSINNSTLLSFFSSGKSECLKYTNKLVRFLCI